MSSQYTIVSEETLEKLVCSSCHNYLSYGKPKIGSNKVICGRCNQEEGILPLFNDNIKNYFFPCINRFDGCKQLLYHSQVAKHELKCKSSGENVCTECKYTGNGCQLYHHYLESHPNNVLRESFFKIYLLDAVSHNYLYRKNNNLFVVVYEVIKPECTLRLKIRNVGANDSNPQYQFIIKSFLKEQQCYKSEYRSILQRDSIELDIFQLIKEHKEKNVLCCFNFNVNGELFTVSIDNQRIRPKVFQFSPRKATRELEEKENQLKAIMDGLQTNLFPKLQCSNCHCFVVPPIYRCPSNHVKSEDDDCSGSFCHLCDDITNWSRAIDLEVFHDFIPLPCRWDCKNMFLFAKLREHEKNCVERRYKCPEMWCSWYGNLDNLIKHWHSSTPLRKQSYQQVYGFQERVVEFYLIFNKEVFYWRMDQMREQGRYIHVRKVSDVSSEEVYSARVLLTHKCDNVHKERQCFIRFGGVTLIDKSYFTYFGQCKNYRIIFSIQLIS